jgi:hypothetical protein
LLIETADPDSTIGDKAINADRFIDSLNRPGTTPAIPPKSIRIPARLRLRSLMRNATSSSASSTNSRTFEPPRTTINLPEIFAPKFQAASAIMLLN